MESYFVDGFKLKPNPSTTRRRLQHILNHLNSNIESNSTDSTCNIETSLNTSHYVNLPPSPDAPSPGHPSVRPSTTCNSHRKESSLSFLDNLPSVARQFISQSNNILDHPIHNNNNNKNDTDSKTHTTVMNNNNNSNHPHLSSSFFPHQHQRRSLQRTAITLVIVAHLSAIVMESYRRLRRPRRLPFRLAIRIIGDAAGMAAVSGMAWLGVLGARDTTTERAVGLDTMMHLHRVAGYVVLGLAVGHGAAKVYGRRRSGFLVSGGGWKVAAGRIALLLMMGAVPLAVLGSSHSFLSSRYRIPFRVWKPVHLLLYLAFPAALIHALYTGTRSPSLRAALYAAASWWLLSMSTRVVQVLKDTAIGPSTITGVQRPSSDTTVVDIGGPMSPALLQRQAGQFILVRKASRSWWSPPSRPHPFTVANAPNQNELRLMIKDTGNNFTKHVSQWRPGDKVDVSGPYGIFTVDWDSKRPIILISAGIGITPNLSILGDACQRYRVQGFKGLPPRIGLVWGVRHYAEDPNTAGPALVDHLHALPSSVLRMCLTVSRDDRVPHYWNGIPTRRGRIGGPTISTVLQPYSPADAEFYICGPSSMLQNTIKILQKWEVPQNQIHYEYFTSW
eukprot:gb/GECH01004578.1/.p1 GENE.gb/GECH01004578.1/~~gb/GECH01004578.1/.p1  ORF type:complete len:617 (+),score=74.49 gb/GECH01004578.1/:1-1851(+)